MFTSDILPRTESANSPDATIQVQITMAVLMPSEIARLVYGYLLEMGCDKTAKTFLVESPQLKEFAEGIRNGHRYATTINQQSLLQMLNGDADFMPKDDVAQKNETNPNVPQLDTNMKASVLNCINQLQNILRELSNVVNEDGNADLSVDVTPRNKLPQRSALENISPRRKCTIPKRITPPQESPSSQAPSSEQSVASSSNTSLTSISSASAQPPVAEVIDYVVNRKLMYEELLNCKPLQEKLASKINNKIANDFKRSSSTSNMLTQGDSTRPVASATTSDYGDFVIGNIEKDLLPPEILDEIINSILDEPECNELIAMVIEKDIQEIQPHKDTTDTVLRTCDSNVAKKSQNDNDAKLVPEKPVTSKANQCTTDGLELRVDKVNDRQQQQVKASTQSQHVPQLSRGAYGFRGLRNKQREVRLAKKSTDTNMSTIIEKIPSSSNIRVEVPNTTVPTAPASVISISKWPTNNSQPYFLPSQHKAASVTKESIILTGLPNANQPIIYLTSHSSQSFVTTIPNASMQQPGIIPSTILPVGGSICALPSGSSLINNPESQLIEKETQQKPTFVADTNSSSSSEPPNPSSRLKLSTPTVLGKPKLRVILPVTSISGSSASPSEHSNLQRQTSSQMEGSHNEMALKPETSSARKTLNGKRKGDASAIKAASATKAKRGAAMMDTDPKIKTLLDTNFDKFLGNIHSISQNNPLQTSKTNNKKASFK